MVKLYYKDEYVGTCRGTNTRQLAKDIILVEDIIDGRVIQVMSLNNSDNWRFEF